MTDSILGLLVLDETSPALSPFILRNHISRSSNLMMALQVNSAEISRIQLVGTMNIWTTFQRPQTAEPLPLNQTVLLWIEAVIFHFSNVLCCRAPNVAEHFHLTLHTTRDFTYRYCCCVVSRSDWSDSKQHLALSSVTNYLHVFVRSCWSVQEVSRTHASMTSLSSKK